jgi:hypothetical protein
MIEHQRIARLLDDAVFHHHDAIAHRHGFDLIVRDVDHRRRESVAKFRDFSPHLNPHLGIQVRERFVEQERLGFANDRAADRDALALSAESVLGRRSR